MHIILISCVSKKKDYSCPAYELYNSILFKYALSYAEKQNPDQIYVLSAEYGLVDIDEIIEPYDKTLNNMKSKARKEWAAEVLYSLQKVSDINNDKYTILAGSKYRENLVPYLKNYEVPLEGLQIGKQLSFYKNYLGE